MQNEPSGFLRHINVAAQLNRGNALLVARDKVHSNEPLAKRNLGIFKDSTDSYGEVLTAVWATI